MPSNSSAELPHIHCPSSNFDQQGVAFSGAFKVLRKGISERAFPGVAAAVVRRGELIVSKGLGRFSYEADSPEVGSTTIFDLASVTKVLATTTMAMILYERGLLDLDAPVIALVPEFNGADARRRQVTVRMLLTHSSGLPAYEKLFHHAGDKDSILSLAFSAALTADPGTRANYSDIGFIILGAILEQVADEPLDRFCQREIYGKLGMARTAFNPPAAWREFIPPTADDRSYRKRVIQGEVQDENASAMGGVAGHAGLFSSATDLANFAHAISAQSLLRDGNLLVRSETLRLFTRREATPSETSRALGWDTPSSPSQSGKYFSPTSFGHLGYTGTSLWIDPERELSIILLTNRTWPDCQSKAITQVRPAFHDAVFEALELEDRS